MYTLKLRKYKLFFFFLFFHQTNSIAQDWTQIASMGTNGSERFGAVSFAIGGKGYVTTGQTSTETQKTTWEYDPISDTWTQKADFTGSWNPRKNASGFVIGNKGYVLGGRDDVNHLHQDLWEFDPVTNIWTRKADYPGGNREKMIAFCIDNYGYAGLGLNGNRQLDFYRYNPANDSWTQLTNIEQTAFVTDTNAFVLNGKAYYATGLDVNNFTTDKVYMFDPATGNWTQKNNFPNGPRAFDTTFILGDKAYLGLGYISSTNINIAFPNDIWQYDEINDTWIQCNSFNPGSRLLPSTFTLGDKAYIGNGKHPSGYSFSTFYSGQPTLSTKEFSVDSFKIASVNNKIIISSDLLKDYAIDIFEMNGKKVLSKEFKNVNGENEIEHQLTAGIYIINFTVDEKSFSKKIIVP